MEDWGPEHWAYYYNEGVNHKELGDKEMSAQFFLKAIEMEPELEMPEAWHNAGSALFSLGKKEEALPYLKKAITLYDLVIHSIREADELEAEYETDMLMGKNDPDDYEDESDDEDSDDSDGDEDDAEDLYFEDDEDEVFVDEPIAAYLYWKACCYALLGDKSLMLLTLEESIAEDDWYAVEAGEEEELSAFRDDASFRSLIDPLVAKISAPDHGHLFDIFEQIETKVLVGFEDPREFAGEIAEKVDEENWSDPTPYSWIRKTSRDLHRKRLEVSKSWTQPTDVERLAAAFDELIETGIAALHHVSEQDFDSVDDVVSELKTLATSPDAIRGVCYYEEEAVQRLIHQPSGSLPITFHSTNDVGVEGYSVIGKKIVEVLKHQGFRPEWGERFGSPIVLPAFSWNKVYISEDDQERWDPWRLFDKF